MAALSFAKMAALNTAKGTESWAPVERIERPQAKTR